MKSKLFLILSTCIILSCEKEISAPVACFEADKDSPDSNLFYFTNCSEDADRYLWIFSDGATSTENNPIHLFETEEPYSAKLIAYNETSSDTLNMGWMSIEIEVLKPNIYIYPETDLNLCVQLTFPLGGNVIKSDPEYNEEWCVHVDSEGVIDNQYTYLFYESSQPNIFQYENGWCVCKDNLESFFRDNMSTYNFSQQEIMDFTDYWIPLLTESKFYCIYPQINEILDKVISLNFSDQPDHIYRLFYGVIESDEFVNLNAPKITPFERFGYYVTEWGVFRE